MMTFDDLGQGRSRCKPGQSCRRAEHTVDLLGLSKDDQEVVVSVPSTPTHSVLIRDNIGDYQVTPLGAHFIARAVGAKNLSQTNREIYGVPDAMGPFAGPGIVEWSWGLNPAPSTNVPPGNLCPSGAPASCGDPHDPLRLQPAAIQQEIQFFRTGMVVQTCAGTGGDGGAAGGPCAGTFM